MNIEAIATRLGGLSAYESRNRIDELFRDHPEVLDVIRSARLERRATYDAIARVISEESGVAVSEASVRRWFRGQNLA